MDSFSIPIVCILAVFSYLAVEVWADVRHKEREAYHNAIVSLVAVVTGQYFQKSAAKNATETSGRQSD